MEGQRYFFQKISFSSSLPFHGSLMYRNSCFYITQFLEKIKVDINIILSVIKKRLNRRNIKEKLKDISFVPALRWGFSIRQIFFGADYNQPEPHPNLLH